MNGARNNGKSCLGTLIASAGLVVSSLWILNFSAGIFFASSASTMSSTGRVEK